MMKDIHTIASFGELEVYEPDDAAKDPYAKFFRMSDVLYFTEQTTKKEEELIGTLFRQFAELSRYEFFTKKLWKKVKGFKDKDEAEVIIAFATIRLRNLGIYTRPCGCAWCSFANWSHQDVNDYLKDYLPVFEAYSKWCMAQR